MTPLAEALLKREELKRLGAHYPAAQKENPVRRKYERSGVYAKRGSVSSAVRAAFRPGMVWMNKDLTKRLKQFIPASVEACVQKLVSCGYIENVGGPGGRGLPAAYTLVKR